MPNPSKPRLTHPRYWPSWLAVGLLRAIGLLPFPLLWLLGMCLGGLSVPLAGPRLRVALRNLRICLPELSPGRRWLIAFQLFCYLGVSALSQGLVWGASRERLARLVRMRNWERLDKVRARGRNIILMVPHFVGLELGGLAITARIDGGMFMYQKIRNPVIDAQMNGSRVRFGALSVERSDDLRHVVREIRRGTFFFYLPDQDAGKRRGIFVPFCGIATSTVPMLGRFAAMGRAAVVPTYARFLPWGRGLELTFDSPLEDFPSGDPEADTAAMNRVIEASIRTMPAQYFWVHRRFKTRPAGEPPIYPVSRRRLRRRRR